MKTSGKWLPISVNYTHECDPNVLHRSESVIQADEVETVSPKSKSDNLPETFGEWMHSFKANLSEVDKALVTARYVQSQSETNDFKTAEVNKALKDHGIKLSNPSTFLKQLDRKKYLFQTRKVGSLSYKRVSVDGQNYLETLKREG